MGGRLDFFVEFEEVPNSGDLCRTGCLARIVLASQSASEPLPLTAWVYGTSEETATASALAKLFPHLPSPLG